MLEKIFKNGFLHEHMFHSHNDMTVKRHGTGNILRDNSEKQNQLKKP